jgi:TetR/AcrR family transcriptional regulator
MKEREGRQGEGKRPFHTKTFEKIDVERREAILSVALRHFAEKGFNGTSINALAREAGISIGSLYSYFASKEDLFLSLVARGHDFLAKVLSDIDVETGFFDIYSTLLVRARDYAIANPDLNLVYLDATTQGLRHLSSRLSRSLESVSVELYTKALASAQRRGEIRSDISIGAAAFCLDNLILLFQFSFASDYYRDRLRIFLGLDEGERVDEDALIAAILDFARRALASPAAPP